MYENITICSKLNLNESPKKSNPHDTWDFLSYVNSELFQIEKRYHNVF
jgi:hypothetical protein